MILTDSLSLLFIGCFVTGLLFLLITALVGHGDGLGHHSGATSHIGHVGGGSHIAHGVHVGGAHVAQGAHVAPHTGQSAAHTPHQDAQGEHFSVLAIVNPLNIALFLSGFGFLGYVLRSTASTIGLPLIIILAGIGALGIATVLIIMLNRIFGSATGTTIQDVSDRTGLLGKVNMTIPQQGIGEIIYVSPGGMRKSVPARSIDGRRLEREQEIVVVNYASGIAEVDTWDHFINQDASISEDIS
jgi:hypothetical protein